MGSGLTSNLASIVYQQPLLAAELDLCVVASAAQYLLTTAVVNGSVEPGAALAWRPIYCVAVALKAAIGTVCIWHLTLLLIPLRTL
jgi:hypothetical protein